MAYTRGRLLGRPVFYRKLPGRTETLTLRVRRRAGCLPLIPVPSMKKMKRAAQLSDDRTSCRGSNSACALVPLGAEELYCNQLSWAY